MKKDYKKNAEKIITDFKNLVVTSRSIGKGEVFDQIKRGVGEILFILDIPSHSSKEKNKITSLTFRIEKPYKDSLNKVCKYFAITPSEYIRNLLVTHLPGDLERGMLLEDAIKDLEKKK